jgi:hypothetical protein
MPRPDQMNINVATWGRLLKKNINLTKSVGPEARELDSSGRRKRRPTCVGSLFFYLKT